MHTLYNMHHMMHFALLVLQALIVRAKSLSSGAVIQSLGQELAAWCEVLMTQHGCCIIPGTQNVPTEQ